MTMLAIQSLPYVATFVTAALSALSYKQERAVSATYTPAPPPLELRKAA